MSTTVAAHLVDELVLLLCSQIVLLVLYHGWLHLATQITSDYIQAKKWRGERSKGWWGS